MSGMHVRCNMYVCMVESMYAMYVWYACECVVCMYVWYVMSVCVLCVLCMILYYVRMFVCSDMYNTLRVYVVCV